MLSQYLLLDRDSGFVVISVRMHADRQTDSVRLPLASRHRTAESICALDGRCKQFRVTAGTYVSPTAAACSDRMAATEVQAGHHESVSQHAYTCTRTDMDACIKSCKRARTHSIGTLSTLLLVASQDTAGTQRFDIPVCSTWFVTKQLDSSRVAARSEAHRRPA